MCPPNFARTACSFSHLSNQKVRNLIDSTGLKSSVQTNLLLFYITATLVCPDAFLQQKYIHAVFFVISVLMSAYFALKSRYRTKIIINNSLHNITTRSLNRIVGQLTVSEFMSRSGTRFSKVPTTFRARKAIRKTPTCLFCKAGPFTCCKGN